MVYRPKIDEKLCFVLMPFKEPFNGYYEHIIKRAVSGAGLNALRADEIYGTRPIINDVWEHIWQARIVIADVTDRNPNVNYELGLCHSLGVSTILITQHIADVPFDYQHRRCIPYNTTEATWSEKLTNNLTKTITAVLLENESDQELRWPYDTFALKGLPFTSSVISVDSPQAILLNGMAAAERLVARALGPRGTNVSVALPHDQIVSRKRGIAIVEGVHSANSIEENGIEQMRKVGRAMSGAVGDGSKTAMLLAHALVEGGQSSLSRGHAVHDILRGMQRAMTAARSFVVANSLPCAANDVIDIARTASNDPSISRLIVEALRVAGNDGVIVIDSGPSQTSELNIQEGLRFDRGFLSPEFVTNTETESCEFADCRVLVHEMKISSMKDLLPLLEQVARASVPLLVIADDVDGEAIATLVVNHLRGSLKCAAVRAPGTGDRRRELLQDIAVSTGATLFASNLGHRLESVRLEDLGGADKVVVTRGTTTIFGGHGSEGAIREHVDRLRFAIGSAINAYDRERLQERLANLAGKIATIRIGGSTEVDVEDRKYRAASAMHSARAAVDDGWSYGAGVALLNARAAVETLAFQTAAEEAGIAIVSTALQRIFSALVESGRCSPETMLGLRIRQTDPAIGFNVETGTLEDVRKAGVLDPTRTLCTALDVAFSYAQEILKTDSWSVYPVSLPEAPQTAFRKPE